jgi:hypothetical protein
MKWVTTSWSGFFFSFFSIFRYLKFGEILQENRKLIKFTLERKIQNFPFFQEKLKKIKNKNKIAFGSHFGYENCNMESHL